MGDAPLDSSNEGYKMLAKMGWKQGEGLGKKASGIAVPISATINEAEGRLGVGKKEQDTDALDNATKRPKHAGEVEETAARKRVREETAQRDETLEQALQRQNAEFYCGCCSKQYRTVSEFAAHLSSYDHHHRKRFAEMKETEKARAGGDRAIEGKRRKELLREEKELQRRIDAAKGPLPEAPSEAPPPAPSAAAPPGAGFSLAAASKGIGFSLAGGPRPAAPRPAAFAAFGFPNAPPSPEAAPSPPVKFSFGMNFKKR
ncbi:hypothetical protein M885DRAFT_514304 [Pelagophyceae sp. CCMP2097]|nr:hypothetical protein M885DRAFT_514304 [Pelagophyceae sp. CCMP2097]